MRYFAREAQQDGHRIIQLGDRETDSTVSITPEFGNNAFEFRQHGHNYLWQPAAGFPAFFDRKALFGVPFLAPWANRLDQDSYWVGNAQYTLNRRLGNIRDDANHKPIHGLMIFETWHIDKMSFDTGGASLTCSFRFTGKPRMIAQFPFAHRLEMTHTLRERRLHVRIKIVSECDEPFPVTIGFHPYFTLPGSVRDDWTLELAARKHVELSDAKIPTGQTTPISSAVRTSLRTNQLDDVFTDLIRDPEGWAVFRAKNATGESKTISGLMVGFGPKYPVAVVYAPKGGNYVCFEPMAAVTDAVNLAHAGVDHELQYVEPGQSWQEEFWIQPDASA